MARPCKRRRVCALPVCREFGPKDKPADTTIQLTVDEFETIRLIDGEQRTQEECARQMNVARTTVQMIYLSARKKLADCLIHQRQLQIVGGNYVVCAQQRAEETSACGACCCMNRARYETVRGDKNMKIAVTYENGQVFQHFGHTEQFKLYTVQDGKIVSTEVLDTNGSGHGALAGFLKEHGVETLICGGIGGGARTALERAGIALYGGVSGEADCAVQAYLTGGLEYDPNVMCSHHHHEEGENCGEHGCGEHSCGSH